MFFVFCFLTSCLSISIDLQFVGEGYIRRLNPLLPWIVLSVPLPQKA